MNDKRKPVIVCTGMCDTKGNEIQFLAEQVETFGGEAVIVDVSLGSASPAWAHIRNDEVLAKAGIEQASDVFTAPRATAIDLMVKAGSAMVNELHEKGSCDAIITWPARWAPPLSRAFFVRCPSVCQRFC